MTPSDRQGLRFGKSLLLRAWNSPTFTTWGSLASRLLSVTLVLPLVLRKFAVPDIAVWQLFSSIITIQLLIDFGFGPTFSRFIAYAKGGARMADFKNLKNRSARLAEPGGDASTLIAVFDTLRTVYLRLALIGFLGLATLGTVAMKGPIAQCVNQPEAWIAWGVIVATSFSTLWGSAYSSVLQGLNRVAQLRRWEAISAICQICSAALVLLLGGGLLLLVIVNQGWAIFGAVRNRWLTKWAEPAFFQQGRQAAPNAEVMSVLWPASWRSGVGILMSQGLVQMSGVIYGQLVPAAELASYLLAIRIMTLVSQFSQAPFYSKLPLMAQLYAQGNNAALLNCAKKGMAYSHWILVAGSAAVLLLTPPLLHLIDSSVHFVPPGLWMLTAIAFLSERYGAMHLQLYTLTNHVIWHIANGVTGSLMIVLGVILYPRLGVIGLPASMLIAYVAFYCWYCASKSYAAFHLPAFRFEVSTSLGPVLTMLVLAGAAVGMQNA